VSVLLNFQHMLTPVDSFQSTVSEIASWLGKIPNPGEAIVRQSIVLRLLQTAGFDIWNPEEVVPEETDKGGFRPDLRVVAGDYQFILELKGMNVGLHPKDYQQVVSYAGSKGIRWAILTDGRSWIVLDEHLKVPYEDRIVVRLDLKQNDMLDFISDIECLLSRKDWVESRFENKIRDIINAQEKRKDVAKIKKEKRPVIESVKKDYGISTFQNAAALSVRLGIITEEEFEILTSSSESSVNNEVKLKQPKRSPKIVPKVEVKTNDLIEFTYVVGEAEAKATYHSMSGEWVVKAGSTAVGKIESYAKRVRRNREKFVAEGMMEELPDGRLVYKKDVVYKSPSGAADDISGASKNG
jgi:predicted type IV restriction endonuclease